MLSPSNGEAEVMDLDVLMAVGRLAAGQTRMEQCLADLKEAVRKDHFAEADCSAEPVDMDLLMAVNRLSAGQGRVVEVLEGLRQDLASLPERIGGVPGRKSRQSFASQPRHPPFNSTAGETRGSFWVGDVGFFQPGVDNEDGASGDEGREHQRERFASDNWPSTVTMRQGFECLRGAYGARSQTASMTATSSSRRRTNASLEDKNKRWKCRAPSWLVVHPSSTFRTFWNLLSVLMVMHDMTVVPVILAWNLPVDGWMLTIAWASCAFWTFDVIFSFVTGFTTHGRLEMRLRYIASRYLSTWFLPEALIVGNDWANLLLESIPSAGSFRIFRFSKALKLFRVIGALRVMKISRVVKEMLEQKLSGLTVIVQCIFASCTALWLSHVLGCVWFGVGRLAPTDTNVRWIELNRDGHEVAFMQESLLFQYMTAVHWAFAQFTLGAIEIGATNSWERGFNIFCLLIGLTFGSTIVSSLSASMVDYQMRALDKTDKLRRLARFLRENRVCHSTGLQVQQQAVERLNMEERLKEENVEVLKLISKTLRLELRHEIYGPHLSSHSLFSLWTSLDKDFVQRLCMEAIDFRFLRHSDELFVAGTCTDRAYYIVSGSMEYCQDSDLISDVEDKSTIVSDGTWLAEASLWSHWAHVGTCRAQTSCQILVVDAEEMAALCQRRGVVREVAADYCRIFHRRIHEARPPTLCFPNDLVVPNTEFCDLLMDMDVQVRTRIGLVALEHLKTEIFKFRRQEDIEHLTKEVTHGRSFLFLDTHGHVERLVHKVVARVLRGDAKIFVQVAKSNDGKRVEGSCKLPRCKTEQGETPMEAYERLLLSLGWSAGDVMDMTSEDEVMMTESRKYKLHTKNLITVLSGTVAGDVCLPTVSLGGPKVSTRSNLSQSTASLSVTRDSSLASSLARHMPSHLPSSPSSARRGSHDDIHIFKAHKADHPDRLCFYTWIPIAKFNYWTGPHGKKDLVEWLSGLRISL